MVDPRNIHLNKGKLQVVATTVQKAVVANDNLFTNVRTNIQRSLEERNMQPQHYHDNYKFPTPSLRKFLTDLINEYGDMSDIYHAPQVWSHRLFTADRKILLSHIVDSDEYEYYCSSPERLDAGFAEHDAFMQKLLDDAAEEVFSERLSEFGYRVENGEIVEFDSSRRDCSFYD